MGSVTTVSSTPSSSTTTPTLTIAVLTFRRPDDLGAILPALVEQAASVSGQATARVLVVDNDPAASARDAVTVAGAAADQRGVRIDYVSETEPGIAVARNRALAESSEFDLLVFIDDDERPSATWLADLLALQRERDAAAVVGPVVSAFAHEPDPWITAGEFFVRRRLPTGTAVDVAATNNLLLDLAFIRREGLRFDAELAVHGGEDTLFTRQIVARGGLMLWCAEALVTDVVPPARLTRRWVVLRAFSSGNGWSLTSVMLAPGALARGWVRARLTARGLVRVLGGVARILRGTLLGSIAQRAKGVRTLARGAGMLGGAWGYRYQEYRRAK
ncbi:glycosyltransferase family 2 protein [Frondihabitans sp. 4ASC-45]|uniref:glycosyltransferase family 2 protein n=1 Tax=Frondihabitans sp. 4ASC-45 TaxID=3111636 RepID=UPI003C2C4FD5